ncbi:MAG TPA: hypothetical protein PLA80_12575, partial [Synergistaceae bacterium]|nr:hypothetical protein [Synergistaceae bacterium]
RSDGTAQHHRGGICPFVTRTLSLIPYLSEKTKQEGLQKAPPALFFVCMHKIFCLSKIQTRTLRLFVVRFWLNLY